MNDKKVKKIKKSDHSFYFAYIGGKTKELPKIMTHIDINKFDTIVEPFCGSSAFSFNIFKMNKDVKYHINDIDKRLFNFINDVKLNGSEKYFQFCNDNWTNDETTKDQYDSIKSNATDNLLSWFYIHKIYCIRIGLYPIGRTFNFNHDEYKQLDEFYMNDKTKISNIDFVDVIEQYKNDDKALIFLDPPYFLSDNSFYNKKGQGFNGMHLSHEQYEDPTACYVYIRDAMKNYKCKIMLIINDCALLRDFFKEFYKESYGKTYQLTKKKSMHMILANFTPNFEEH